MTERLFGTNPHYLDSGDFSQRYFYQLRGCVPPPQRKTADIEQQKTKSVPRPKSIHELVMDKARTKVNRRYKG